MDSSSRHSPTVTPFSADEYLRAISPANLSPEYYAIRVRPSLARRMVRVVLRKSSLTNGTQRPEPWPVADKRRGSSLGGVSAAHAELALQRLGRLPNKSWWD